MATIAYARDERHVGGRRDDEDGMDAGVSASLSDEVRAFLEVPRFAVVATIGQDGAPHQAVVWYLLVGDTIVVNSADGRRWPANLRRDPRAAITVEDGYRYVQVAGTVEVDDDQGRAQADIAAMAHRYHSNDPAAAEDLIVNRFRLQHRVSFRLLPEAVLQDL